jgi:hypothetical protein
VAAGDLERELARLRAENSRLLRLLGMRAEQARTPEASQSGLFLEQPGMVTASSTPEAKVAFCKALFAAREDVYAIRWENERSGKSGWVPAVAGGWRKGTTRPYLRLRDDVVAAHLCRHRHRRQVLGLDQLLERRPLVAGDRRDRHPPPPVVGRCRGPRQPPTRHRHAAADPVRVTRRCQLARLHLRAVPERYELRPWHSQGSPV